MQVQLANLGTILDCNAASFGIISKGEPLLLTRDLPDDQSVNNQLGPSTTTPIAATIFHLNSSECVVGTIS